MNKEEFFGNMEMLGLALTYDDVRLRTGYSEVMPENVNLETKFSRNVSLNVPIVGAAMDTVTEYRMAIGLAMNGGLGVIHRGLSPEMQAFNVERVKYKLNVQGLVERPITVSSDDTIEEILRRREENEWEFHSFPVTDVEGRLVGIITHNDFDFCNDVSQEASEVMTPDPITLPADASRDEAYRKMQEKKKKVIPLVDDERRVEGLYVYNDIRKVKDEETKIYNADENGQLRVGAAIGTGESALSRLEKLVEANVDVVVIDTAHGDSAPVRDTLQDIKDRYEGLDVVVGNISEPESAERLADWGADGIKVGQGPGSICTTRVVAGIGAPQITAVYECSQVADEYGIPICADGGIKHSGDIPVAIGAGAHSVMIGSLLAGTEEAPGEKIYKEGRLWKEVRGMGSLGAMSESSESRERYREAGEEEEELVPEGVEGRVPYKGLLDEVFHQLEGGLRRGMGYVGAADIEELRDKARFRRLSSAGKEESHPHDVEITREAPNYNPEGS